MSTKRKKKMANEIVVIAKEEFSALASTGGQMTGAMAALVASGEKLTSSDLTRVPTPTGGGTVWQIPTVTGDPESVKEIVGVLVGYHKCGILWPSEEPQENAMPVLRTWDLVVAEQIGPIPDEMIDELEKVRIPGTNTYRWEALSYNQWNSGKGGQGKRCKEQRMMFVLRKNDAFPLLITVQPGSLKSITNFIKKVGMSRIPYWQAIIGLSLEKVANNSGQPYSRIVPRLAGTLNEEDGVAVYNTWTKQMKTMLSRIDEGEATEE